MIGEGEEKPAPSTPEQRKARRKVSATIRAAVLDELKAERDRMIAVGVAATGAVPK